MRLETMQGKAWCLTASLSLTRQENQALVFALVPRKSLKTDRTEVRPAI